MLAKPIEGALFDVEHNGFWPEGWGTRPTPPKSAVGTALRMLRGVPRMIPVYGHRYVPAGRGTYGHPVLSMWQTDIIVYGSNLADYVDREFGKGNQLPDIGQTQQAYVACWRDFL
jgi:hypothetical protein